MARYLVTGGAGFIGSHLAAALAHLGEVIVLDDFSSGRRSNLEGTAAQILEADVRDARVLARACEGVDAVFHLAARVSVAGSMERPEETLEVNTLGTLAVLEAAARAGVRSIVFSSSAAVYGDDPRLPKRESMSPAPRSPYALSKLDGEHLLGMFAESAGIRSVALRYFNVFGPRQDPRSPYAAVVPAFVASALAGQPMTIFGDGKQTRDFVFVEDVVLANLLAAGVAAPPRGAGRRGAPARWRRPAAAARVYNVGSGRSVTIGHLARLVLAMTGSASRVVHADARPGDVRHSRADVSRIRRELGFRTQVPLEEGLRRTVEAARVSVGP